MTIGILSTLLIAGSMLGLCGVTATASAGDIRTEHVHFPKGEIGATIKGHIRGDEIIDYKLRVRAGQSLSVGLKTDNASNYFNILAPGEHEEAFFIGSNDGNDYTGDARDSGNYTIRVYLMRNAARRGERAHYTLDVGAAVAGDVPSEADGRNGSGRSVSGHQMDPDILIKMRARGLDGVMNARGFSNAGGYKSDGASMTSWWNADTRQCISVETRDGRIANAETIVAGNCQ
jgi:hypothetical protein